MSDSVSATATTRTPRQIADEYVETLSDLDPVLAVYLGNRPGSDALPDYSPEGIAALADAHRATLTALDAAAPEGGAGLPDDERRAARLLRERLGAQLNLIETGEKLRDVAALFSPAHQLRQVVLLMPAKTEDDWAVIARRLRNLPGSARGYIASLREGLARGLAAAPRQAEALLAQIDEWLAKDWFRDFASAGPDALRGDLDRAASEATAGMAELRDFLRDTYLPHPATAAAPDGVGRDRYLRHARHWTGSDLDLQDAYAYGWEEFERLAAEMRATAGLVLPGATPAEAMAHLRTHGEAIEGEEEIRRWLQALMERATEQLAGTHFDLPEPVRRVETHIAPPGSSAAPYYTRPSLDFSRPGRTWLPTLGATRFPVWDLVSVWYHEGLPGHHLQFAHWVYVKDRLSRYQIGPGSVSGQTEGWALYAERLMDELGFLTNPEYRLGYLSEQMLRAIRVIIDIGMHLGLRIPAGLSFHPGEVWTPALGLEFLRAHTGLAGDYAASELVRYLGRPGQAISYKLGERAWLAGREAARAAAAREGRPFDLKSWHMAALSLGALGLDDLAEEISVLG
ncbi:DUF885 domain-containing protein [Streptomyces sp. 7-21]|uniref:DUF885 domain-containing protein n=1 Tax=Streptomyces sp. 7-21 TaxID=2802283 RepID=UPI00191E4D1B|nr:DUF885 domain-containing protein [Streptomyces sp. 7-21]MBL1066034.1 DUF885 domain-containing protein [Streptomyces sp. 7-21]